MHQPEAPPRAELPVAPIMAALSLILLILPLVVIVPMSFGGRHELLFPPREFTWDLYRAFFTESNWLEVTLRSGRLALCTSLLALAVGVPAAYGLARTGFRFRDHVRLLLLGPIVTPTVVFALGLYMAYLRLGVSGTFGGLLIGHAVYACPFVMVTVAPEIRRLDRNIEIATAAMGAWPLRIFLSVVVPQLWPAMASAALFAFLLSFDEVIISWFVASSGDMTLPVKMYASIQNDVSPVLSAVSTILLVVSIAVCFAAALLKQGRR